MSDNPIAELVKERDDALHSLDRDKLIAYMNKYGVRIPQDELVFWAAIHKARANNINMTPAEVVESLDWLQAHGMSGKISL